VDIKKSKKYGRELREEAPGSRTRGFFTDVASGVLQAPNYKNFHPTIYGLTIRMWDAIFNEIGIGPFNKHIYCSIPTYFEYERAIAAAIVAALGNESTCMLDIGASEGTFCKVVSYASKGKIKTFALDANSSMKANFDRGKKVLGCEFVHAFIAPDNTSTSYLDKTTGLEIPRYEFDQKFDCVVESMFFQFLGSEREEYVKKIKSSILNDGLFICAEKFLSNDDNYYIENEINKYKFKSFHFSEDQINQKYEEILEDDGMGMDSKQVKYEYMEELLCKYFTHVTQIWDSGNFKGYACSDSKSRLDVLLNGLPDLNSEFSTFSTPSIISPY
jgi:hypothetical protein